MFLPFSFFRFLIFILSQKLLEDGLPVTYFGIFIFKIENVVIFLNICYLLKNLLSTEQLQKTRITNSIQDMKSKDLMFAQEKVLSYWGINEDKVIFYPLYSTFGQMSRVLVLVDVYLFDIHWNNLFDLNFKQWMEPCHQTE